MSARGALSARFLIVGGWQSCPRYLKGEPDSSADPDWVMIDERPTEYTDAAKAERIAKHPRVNGRVVPA